MGQTLFERLGVALALLVIGSALLAMPALAAAPGAIVSWGNDVSGAVSQTPTGTDFIAVSAGGGHSLALRADGSIAAWGLDDWGQVSETPTDTGYIAVAAGDRLSVALRADGSLVSWGDDRFGQVSQTPTGTGFTAIAAGNWHSLALREDGSLVSWGRDEDYLGIKAGQVSQTPTGTGFTAIAAGGTHSLALRADGSIAAWGWDKYGQVSHTPTGTGFTAIAAGNWHSLAIRPDSSIAGWGFDVYGLLLSDTPTGDGFTAIEGGIEHNVALRADGSITSWGNDVCHLLTDTPTGTGFTAIAAGGSHSLALRTVDSTPPTIVSTTPADGSRFVPIETGAITVTFDEPIVWDADPVLNMQVRLYDDNQGEIPIGTVRATGNTLTISAPASPSPWFKPFDEFRRQGVYTVKISGVRDLAGNVMYNDHICFITAPLDTTPPAIISTSPVDGAVKVPIETNAITVEFSEPIRYVPSSGIQVSLVTSTDRGYVDYPMGEITASGTTLTIAAPAGTAPWFENWKDYYVTVYGVQDLAGNDMATAGNLIRFHTVSTDTTPPTVDSTSPGNGALGVAADAAITATMSETINACVGTITIVDDLGNAVPLEEGRGWDTSDYRTVEVHPAGPLTPGRTYTVTMAGMIDSYLNEMASYSWSFTVGVCPVAAAGADLTAIVNEKAAFDGSGSTDADGTIVSYAWDFGDGTTGTGMTASHTYMASGAYTVSLQVTDNDGLEGSDTLMVMVRTPDEATEDLAETVDGMDLRADIETGLTDKLDLAIAALNAENGKMAINNLNAFISLVKAQRGKALTAPQASVLTAEAQRIIQNIRPRSVS